jgi:hypothetical protein
MSTARILLAGWRLDGSGTELLEDDDQVAIALAVVVAHAALYPDRYTPDEMERTHTILMRYASQLDTLLVRLWPPE